MDELEHEGPAGDDALTTREEVATYNPIPWEPEVSGENHRTTDVRLTSQVRWTSLQTGSQPCTRQNQIRGAMICPN